MLHLKYFIDLTALKQIYGVLVSYLTYYSVEVDLFMDELSLQFFAKKRLLNKDHRKRMTAAQALAHPWLRDENPGLLVDFSIYKLVKSYIRASPFRRAALKSLSKAIPEEELVFLKAQFMLMDPEDEAQFHYGSDKICYGCYDRI